METTSGNFTDGIYDDDYILTTIAGDFSNITGGGGNLDFGFLLLKNNIFFVLKSAL